VHAKKYVRKAKVMTKVRRLLIEVISDETLWKKFTTKVKQDDIGVRLSRNSNSYEEPRFVYGETT